MLLDSYYLCISLLILFKHLANIFSIPDSYTIVPPFATIDETKRCALLFSHTNGGTASNCVS